MAVKNWIKGSRAGPKATVSRAEEDALVERCKSGDRKAFGCLLQEYEQGVLRFLCRLVGNEEDAHDICQEALLQAWLAIGGFHGVSSFKVWLYKIALQQRALFWRRNGKKHKYAPLPHGDDFAGKVLGREPEREVGHALETQELAQHLLRQLPPDLQEVFLLREEGGLSYKEIAQCLDVPVTTVTNRLHTASMQLKDIVSRMRETLP